MIYGYNGTIHKTGEVNVELDENGKVVSVWFRCMALPFTQNVVDNSRAEEMQQMYAGRNMPLIRAIDVEDV